MTPHFGSRSRMVLLWLALLALPRARAGNPKPQSAKPNDLTEMSLDELANIEVTSVGKKQQKLSEAAAAVYVITQEDIRRSGATSIPEALRMAPGLDVARIDSSTWAVSSRGFNGQYSSKMLVLVDGRSVYTPLFSGVYWDTVDLPLEDIERIEVIRGPGATMWGANAVNGVINIISKRARDTQGGLVSTGAGNEEEGFSGFRYGARLGSKAYYRVYSKYFQRSDLLTPTGLSAADEWHTARGGFRMDWDSSDKDSVTVEGDFYGGRNGQPLTTVLLAPPYSQGVDGQIHSSGGDVLTRWRRTFSANSEMELQLSYGRTDRHDAILGEVRDTFEADFQHRFTLSPRHEILWGLGYQFTTDQIDGTAIATLNPNQRGTDLYSAFAQDEVTLAPDRLRLALGSKFEHNYYTGFEVQPSARLLWTPYQRHGFWISVARAVRTPSRGERDGRLNVTAFPGPNGLPLLVSFVGNRRFGSEDLLAYELGYRLQPTGRFSLDVASFYNVYTNLSSIALDTPFPEATPAPLHVVVSAHLENLKHGRTHGVEITAHWNPAERWKLSAGYTGYAGLPIQPPSALAGPEAALGGSASPGQQVHFRSYLDLTQSLQFDTALYYVGPLPTLSIPSYTRLDVRLGWRVTPELDLSLGLQNPLDGRHPEFISEILTRQTEIGRSAYGKVTWRF